MLDEKHQHSTSPSSYSNNLTNPSAKKKLRVKNIAFWLLSVLVTLVLIYNTLQFNPLTYFYYSQFRPSSNENEGISGPIGVPYIPEFMNNNNPSSLQFSVKHVFHQNVDKPIGQAMMGRLDMTEKTLKKLRAETPLVAYGSEEVSPWDSIYAIDPNYNYMVTRLQDRSPEHVQSYIDYANTYKERKLPEIKSQDLAWIDEEIAVPNVTDKDTVVSLAIMASNAYVDIPYTGDWLNVTGDWGNNNTYDFGWKADGIRGHVFLSEKTKDAPEGAIVVVSIKGTSAAILDNGGDTAPNDKINDNLLFSCCCARVSYMWNTVCDCYTGKSYTCNQDCLERELYKKDKYYKAVLEIYRQVQELYPDSQIWVTGHSLGGSLAALLGRTYGLPAVAFEAPGELLPAKRLHLPMPPGLPSWREHVWHFGHTADPIYIGQCNGATSSCSMAGYAMETVCHSGLECSYDVVGDLGWHVSLMNHRIHVVIDSILLAYNKTAECKAPPACHDCIDWRFVTDDDDDHSDPLPSKSTSQTVTQPITTKTTTIAPPTGPVTTIDPTSTPPSTTQPPSDDNNGDGGHIEPDPPKTCHRRNWYGRCVEW